MYLADYHVHSTCSQDGRQTMAQAAQAAVAAGMDELCLTDHVDTIYWGPEQKPRWDFDWDAVRRAVPAAVRVVTVTQTACAAEPAARV